MSSNNRQLLAFVTFISAWSLMAGGALGLKIHPIAVFAVWLAGFVWGAGYIASGKSDADLLLKRWFQMIIGVAAIGGAVALFLS
ncbi:hypothetical protein [Mesorhizobium sp. Root172]|uniref:hypothetical protein n=1 Tax=Mesorhizobium sp. Root172 TaxID=1736481 RepID=UPI0006F92166|nr:hypothetical protein [Mesorhizobium sp. Root172]KRB22670.1 hypothetical protein ASE05_15915 [Mesorhizobium sp. Root172]